MKSHIRWTAREWALLAGEFKLEGCGAEDYGFTPALERAMKKQLPKERWRPMSGISAGAKKPMATALKLYELNQPKPVPEPEKVKSEPQNEVTTEFLLVELAKRLAVWLEPATALKTSPVDRGFYPPPRQIEPEKVDMRPRLLVIGPINGQQRELSAAHPRLDLRFVASDEGPARVDDQGPACDEIILWTNYLNHQHQVHAKATKRPTFYVSGGMAALHARLKQWEAV